MPWTAPEVLEHAISDGINVFVRDVLIRRGLIDEDRYESETAELLKFKYAVAEKVAALWLNALREATGESPPVT